MSRPDNEQPETTMHELMECSVLVDSNGASKCLTNQIELSEPSVGMIETQSVFASQSTLPWKSVSRSSVKYKHIYCHKGSLHTRNVTQSRPRHKILQLAPPTNRSVEVHIPWAPHLLTCMCGCRGCLRRGTAAPPHSLHWAPGTPPLHATTAASLERRTVGRESAARAAKEPACAQLVMAMEGVVKTRWSEHQDIRCP
eukprot:1136697-Pelagomonas_calceolata.AAC.6